MSFTTIVFVKNQNLKFFFEEVGVGVFGVDNNKDFVVRELGDFLGSGCCRNRNTHK